MISLRVAKKGAMLAAVVGSIFLTAYPGPAQTPEIQDRVSGLLRAQRYALHSSGELIASEFFAPESEMLGATLQPLGDTLRAQLGIPAGQGLVIESLRGDGASALAGLQQNDVLLFLADKPLATTEDLTKQLKAAGEAPVALKLLRAGKPITIQVRPIYRVTLGPVGEQKTEYYIGISLVGPNDTVRAQLSLPDNHGMVINDVESGSAAEKAGVKKYDIVLEVDGKPIDSGETLTSQIQATQGKPATLKILRGGKPMTLSVTPAMRKVEATLNPRGFYNLIYLNSIQADSAEPSLLRMGPAQVLRLRRVPQEARIADYTDVGLPDVLYKTQSAPTDANELRQRLENVEKELTAVRAALDKLNETLKADKGNKRN
jgi:membrane-associated protease RseP (regulator of RpoE activity)